MIRFCYCGCGSVVRWKFKRGHGTRVFNWAKGKHWKLSEETKVKQGIAKLDENNPQWKGDKKIDYVALHVYVKRRIPKPEVCPICKIKPTGTYDLANVTGIYNRDLSNWQYQCRRCHMNSDGRMKNLKQFQEVRL